VVGVPLFSWSNSGLDFVQLAYQCLLKINLRPGCCECNTNYGETFNHTSKISEPLENIIDFSPIDRTVKIHLENYLHERVIILRSYNWSRLELIDICQIIMIELTKLYPAVLSFYFIVLHLIIYSNRCTRVER